jgi:hypothetical protein
MTTSREMPRYQCHKQVWALKIKDIDFDTLGGAVITPSDAGYAPFEVDGAYCGKHSPEVGGYFVVYDGGYKSYSPAEAFEAGYAKLP